LAINEALTRLEQEEPRQAEIVVLRYFAGLSIDECAEALDVAPRTVDNGWRYAKAWLHRELSKGDITVCRLSKREGPDGEARARPRA
jgi:DNA-directed RNA polymerase specialized sigma24 family protein